jgi:hypothetical protein
MGRLVGCRTLSIGLTVVADCRPFLSQGSLNHHAFFRFCAIYLRGIPRVFAATRTAGKTVSLCFTTTRYIERIIGLKPILRIRDQFGAVRGLERASWGQDVGVPSMTVDEMFDSRKCD